ncbi:ATP-binding protein [Phytoactinopolyspora halotolerans]|uniref:ATP-binding protein n=1 Tax=Phytoactinopolyspora halotolerans TaxID=1981512 RepID=A0A6L9SGR5_9ACTN|nr:ATP-binding protein [Phytoactinopolyspora halotolerans]NEE04327.1 ATP-binding protein [Phytoactinopolyspora halotolerans]
MIDFVGRDDELSQLSWLFDQVRDAVGGREPGQCVQMRGRRRIGKSSLVEEFLRRADVPAVFFTAERRSAEDELGSFWRTVVDSGVDQRGLASAIAPHDWSGAFQTLALVLPDDQPTVVVIDELPYLIDQVDAFEGILQKAWDRELSRKPVLLILVGSDLGMMEALNQYDRPFHQRGREMVVGPLNPADVARMLELDAADAFDATLVTGGLPLICAEWERGATPWDYLESALSNPLSALLVSAERVLAAEFPPSLQARHVLGAIGSGERTFTNIARAAGDIPQMSLNRALDLLRSKRIVDADLPLSNRPSKERRYRVSDPYLQFWFTFIEPNLSLIERRRPDLALERVRRHWTTWRGRAVEPLVRKSLARLLPAQGIPAAAEVGAYWTRSNDVEIDIVGADRGPVATHIYFVGSIKWLDQRPFDLHDLGELALHRGRLPGAEEHTPLLAVSRSGVTVDGLASFDPEDLVAAWT